MHQSEPSVAPEWIVPPPPMSEPRFGPDREAFPLPGNTVLYAALAGLASCLPLIPVGLLLGVDEWQLVAVLAGLWAALMAGGAALADRRSRTRRRSRRWALGMCLAGLPVGLVALGGSAPAAWQALPYGGVPRAALLLLPGVLSAVCGVASAAVLGTLMAWALRRDAGAEKRAMVAGSAAALVWVAGAALLEAVSGAGQHYGLSVYPAAEYVLRAVTALLAGALVGNALACRWVYAWRNAAHPLGVE